MENVNRGEGLPEILLGRGANAFLDELHHPAASPKSLQSR